MKRLNKVAHGLSTWQTVKNKHQNYISLKLQFKTKSKILRHTKDKRVSNTLMFTKWNNKEYISVRKGRTEGGKMIPNY
jgi:hypothetical protein